MTEQKTYEEWFHSMQGKPYDSMWLFAEEAWKTCADLKDAQIKDLKEEVLRLQREVINRNQRALDGDKAINAFDNIAVQNEALLTELHRIEWVEFDDSDWGTQIFCPTCRNAKKHGHYDGCTLHEALSIKQKEKGEYCKDVPGLLLKDDCGIRYVE
jgi:hypothetical protein